MRLCLSSSVFAAALLLGAGAAVPAMGQSADDIIRSLRPGNSMGSAGRGIGPVAGPRAPDAGIGSTGGSMTAPVPHQPSGQRVGTVGARPMAQPPAAGNGVVNLTVQFGNNSADLTPAAMRTLDALGQALTSSSLSGYRFRIEGHTDALGNPERNRALSEQRAAKVVDYLVGKFGVDRSKVEAIGMGQDQPLVPGPANVAEPRNRRVTVVNVGT